MHSILKEKGLKSTQARLDILDIISKSKCPVNAFEIYNQLKKEKKNINEATVYRTLTSLVEGTILRKVDFRKDSAYFELEKNHHHHIVCITCNTVEDFESKKVEEVLASIALKSSKFISIKDHSLELFGFCKSCEK